MRKKLNVSIAAIAAFVMLLGLYPISALAADDENVLTSVYHTSAVSAVDVTEDRLATLTVPYSYTGTIDLSNGLDLFYNTSIYTSVSTDFPNGSVAEVNGDAVEVLIIYQKKEDQFLSHSTYEINVVRASQTSPAFSGTIYKTAALLNKITFTEEDFKSKYTQNDGDALDHIIITGSNPSFGELKFKSESALGKTISISDVDELTFTPTREGTVSYTINAFNSNSDVSVGVAILTITAEANNAGTVTYMTKLNTPITLSSADFSAAFKNTTGKSLAYINYVVPSASYGKLYYNYRSSSYYDSVVSADTKYYASGSPNISDITFVPYTDYTGDLSISYTAYGSDGIGYSGTLTITVENTDVKTITYKTNADSPVTFDAAAFSTVCEEATGNSLSYVNFTTPNTTYGKLYYDYSSPTDYDSVVAVDTKYFRSSSPYLSNVYFVPKAGSDGTVTLYYTGCNTDNITFTGKIDVIISNDSNTDDDFKDVGEDLMWARESINYLYKKGIITGNGSGYYNPHASISRGDFILMLCRAFDLEADTNGNFSDVDADSYYYNAIATAKSLGIAKGAKGKFNPRSALSRQDAMVLIVRALDAAGITLEEGSEADLQEFSDSDKISDYAVDAFEALVKADIIQGSDTSLKPKSSVTRAEMAVLLYRILTM